MGQSLTKEEELFRRGEFTEALVASAEREPPNSLSTSPPFIMAPVEWETMATLCDSGDEPIKVRSTAAKIDLAASDLEEIDGRDGTSSLYCPLVCCVAQLIAADFGVIPYDEARARWRRVHRVVVEEATGAVLQSPIGWMREQHRKMLNLFVGCAEADPADHRMVTKAILNATTAASSTDSTGFAGRPVIALLLRYCAVSIGLKAAAAMHERATAAAAPGGDDGGADGSAVSGDDKDRQRLLAQANDLLLTAISTLTEASRSLNDGVQVAFLKKPLKRATDMLFEIDLEKLALMPSSQHAIDGAHNDGAAAKPSWATVERTFVGQRHAVDELRDHYRARQEGLTPSEKPTVIVFFGPSGHGKTELGRLLAAVASGDASPEDTGAMVLVHMTSYCTRDSIYSLVDPPAAHVGEGLLISALRKAPHATIILDEFEKSTADAVQNVWLSAFPRNGMLRSLKDASRSVSTTKATFVLTCNTLADGIERQRDEYLRADAARRGAMREQWAAQCRRELRDQFGEPFVARIDSFIPFVPYTVAETREYVNLQVEHVRRKLQRRGRDLEVTETFAAYLTGEMARRGFHGSRVEQTLQPHLLALADKVAASAAATGTVGFARIAPSARMLLHARPTMRPEPDIVRIVGDTELRGLGLAGATALARRWDAEAARDDDPAAPTGPAPRPRAATAAASRGNDHAPPAHSNARAPPPLRANMSPEHQVPSTPSSPPEPVPPAQTPSSSSAPTSPAAAASTASAAGLSSPTNSASGAAHGDHHEAPAAAARSARHHEDPELQVELEREPLVMTKRHTERDTKCETEREKLLATELAVVKAKNMELEKQVESLKETIRQLETALAVALAVILALLAFLSLFVSLSTLISLCAIATLALQYFVGNAAYILGVAFRGFVHLLGPARSAAFGLVLVGWLYWHAQPMIAQCQPCPAAVAAALNAAA